MNNPLSNRGGDFNAETKGGDEVKESRPKDGQTRGEYARRDNGGDGIGRVVKAVNKIEGQGNTDDCEDKVVAGHDQAFLTTMPSMVLATSSQRSMAASVISY